MVVDFNVSHHLSYPQTPVAKQHHLIPLDAGYLQKQQRLVTENILT
jgi:hypothetical protein